MVAFNIRVPPTNATRAALPSGSLHVLPEAPESHRHEGDEGHDQEDPKTSRKRKKTHFFRRKTTPATRELKSKTSGNTEIEYEPKCPPAPRFGLGTPKPVDRAFCEPRWQ